MDCRRLIPSWLCAIVVLMSVGALAVSAPRGKEPSGRAGAAKASSLADGSAQAPRVSPVSVPGTGAARAADAVPDSSTGESPQANVRQRMGCGDLDGRWRVLGGATGTRAVVVVFLATECPISNGCLPHLNQLHAAQKGQGVEVYGVISSADVSRTEAVAHRKEYGIRFPVLFDASGELRAALKATHSPHAFVMDEAGAVRYQGAVDNGYAAPGRKRLQVSRRHVQEAVSALLAGRRVDCSESKPIGCLLERRGAPVKAAAVTFTRDVAPILQTHCAQCHRPGEVGPFSLLTYEDARRHARQMVEVTRSHQMPPWKPEPQAHAFADELRLTEFEIDLLARWEATGMAEGEAADLPPAPTFPRGWQLGTPDLILEMPEAYEVPETGPDLYRHFVVPTGLSEDRLVAAVEFRPGNPRVVHHASFYLDPSHAARVLDAADPEPGYSGGVQGVAESQGTLHSWLPGTTPRRLPERMGRLMLRGSDLVLEIHYHPSGKPERDRSRIGLYFAPRQAKQAVIELQVLNSDLRIPAGESRHVHRASYTLPVGASLLDVCPHMHLLGRSIRAWAVEPDGREHRLVDVRDWDFRWQGQYAYSNPVRLPKGTRIEVEAVYDNSAENPLNPHSPPQPVTWGEQSEDEMCIVHFQLTCSRWDELTQLHLHMGEYIRADIARRPPATTLPQPAASAPTP